MSRIDIPCPQCGKLLALPDPSYLGKKGKCPRCEHKFLLHAPPTNVQFATIREHVWGTEGNAPDQASAESIAGGVEPSPVPSVPGAEAGISSPVESGSAPIAAEGPAFDLGAFEIPTDSAPKASPVSKRTPRQSRGRLPRVVWGAALMVILGSGGAVAWFGSQHTPPPSKALQQADVKKSDAKKAVGRTSDETRDLKTTAAAPPAKRGKRISLRMIPLGVRILVHLRPAQLWAEDEEAEEFRACLGPLVPALERQLADLCLFPPRQIESVLVAFIPISRDAFDLAVVVRTNLDLKRSELTQKFNGELVGTPQPHYVGPQRVYVIQDARTFASAPVGMKETFLDAAQQPLDASEGIASLLAKSDSERPLTIIAELEDLRNGVPTLVPASAQPLLRGVVDFFGDDVETLAFSFDLPVDGEEGRFRSELQVRNLTTRSAANLGRDLRQKLEAWPKEMLELAHKTRPETVGHMKLVGRFPAMTKVVEQSVQESSAKRLVTFTLDLPAIAAPNLAAASLLTWDYSTRASFGVGQATQPASGREEDASMPIAQRLRKPISVEFRNEFLFKALEFIGDEIGVKFKTDGPGMQRVGVTQNIKQDMKYDNTPAAEILNEMLVRRLKDRELCAWIDEANRQVVVTSRVVAEEQKRTLFALEAK